MPETVKLVDLDIDQAELLKKITKLQQEITDLKDDTKTLTKANKDLEGEGKKNTAQYKANASQIEKNKAQTKGLSTEYRNNQNVLVALNSTENKQLGTLQQLEFSNKKLREEAKRLDLTRKSGQDRLTNINKQLDQNNKTILENADATKAQKINVGNYGSALQGIGGPLAGATAGIQAMTRAALAFIATPIGLVIAAIGLAIGALTSFFKRSEEGQNALTKVVKVFSAVLDNFLDILSNVGEALFKAFTEPKESLEDLKNFIQGIGAFFKNTFGNIIGGSINIFVGNMQKGFANIGLAWQKFKGIFVDNADGIEEAQGKIETANKKIEDGQERIRAGVEVLGNTYDKARAQVSAFFKEVSEDAEAARKLAESEAKIRIEERRIIVENARLGKESAQLRADAEKQKLIDAEKSLALFSESFDLDEKILANELKIAETKAENARIAGELAKSDIETLDEIARLEADVENKRKAFDETRRGRTRRLNAIRLEAFKQEKERLATELELQELVVDERIRANERIIDDEISTNDQILVASRQNTALRLELIAQESDLELQELNSRLEFQLIAQADFELQRELIKKKFADQALIELEKNQDLELKLTESVEQAKLDVADGVAAATEALFKENTIAAKFAAIAQALINTFLGAQAAFAQTPGGIGIKTLAAVAATAIGLANVRKIRKVQLGQTGTGSSSTGTFTTPRGEFVTGQRVAQSDGGLTTQVLINETALSIRKEFAAALKEAPPILVVEQVTVKQQSQKAVSQVTTV